MSVRDTYLPILDAWRGRLDTIWGLRLYTVSVRVTTWEGPLPGQGTATVVTTALTVNGARPKVEQLASRDIIASGGLYQAQDITIGPLTPPYTDANGDPAGVSIDVFAPALTGPGVEVLFVLEGPGTATGGDIYRRVSDTTIGGTLRYSLVLRKVGAQ